MSSSKRPRQIKKMLRAGMRFEKGIGRGSDKKADDRTIANPHKMCEPLVLVMGCLKADILDVKLLNLTAAL